MLKPLILSSLLSLSPYAVTADEVWTTPQGDIVYEQDAPEAAIWSMPINGAIVSLYFPGLSFNYNNRSTHEGYWISDGATDCTAMLYGSDGRGSRSWGRAIVTFDGAAFPSDLTLWWGDCFAQPSHPIRGLSTAK